MLSNIFSVDKFDKEGGRSCSLNLGSSVQYTDRYAQVQY